MNSLEIEMHLSAFAKKPDIPAYCPVMLSGALLSHLRENWEQLPFETRGVLLGTIAVLRREALGQVAADEAAAAAVEKMKRGTA